MAKHINSLQQPAVELVDEGSNPLLEEEGLLRSRDADLQQEATSSNLGEKTKQQSSQGQSSCPYSFVPLKLDGRSHKPSSGSKSLIQEEVSLKDLQKMTDLFYEKAFQDSTLDKFIRSHNDPHGERFAKWIHQKLSGSSVWDVDRQARDKKPVKVAGNHYHVVHDRTSAHVGAWYSPKRPASEVGRHFQLDECRVWMRLHFWALRESGIMAKSPSFADYYVRFIGHFVNVYESTAPMFTRESLRWSSDPKNIETYVGNGRRMVDVLGLTLKEAEAQLPEEEANDFEWPYNQTQ